MGRLQHRQAALDGEARRDDQHVPGEAPILRMRHLVEHLPGDEHGHHHRLAGTRGHLGAQALKAAAVGGDVQAHPLRRRRLAQPNQRLRRLQLAEEEAPGREFLRVRPIPKQTARDAGNARIAGLPPRLDAGADAVDQGNLHKDAGVVKGLGILRGDDVAGGTTARRQVKQAGAAVITPMPRRLLVGGVDDQAVNGGLGHQPGSGETSGPGWAARNSASKRAASVNLAETCGHARFTSPCLRR